ncbi:MAG: alpha/beta fold hydrolase [Steroidobacteraceae bacterium]
MIRALRFEGSTSDSIVLLPAVRTRPEDAVTAGFVAAAQGRPRLIFADVPTDELRARPDFAALLGDLVAPEIEAGRKTWLVGLSLGGWLALQLARAEPRVAGIGLIAPWLGARTLPTDDERTTWDFLASTDHAPLWLGFGREDRFADVQQRAAMLLPAERVSVVPGGHDWPCWRVLWDHFLTWASR